jgi:hypothetical protein
MVRKFVNFITVTKNVLTLVGYPQNNLGITYGKNDMSVLISGLILLT